MARLKEIDLEEMSEGGAEIVILSRHILALERAHEAMEDTITQIVGWSDFTTRPFNKDSLAEPERILPSGRDMWEMKIGRQAVNTEHCYALRQQTTVEAICVWLEKIAHRQCASDMCRILRADAERVVREAGGGE